MNVGIWIGESMNTRIEVKMFFVRVLLGAWLGSAGVLQAAVLLDKKPLRDPEVGMLESGAEVLMTFGGIEAFSFSLRDMKLLADQNRLKKFNRAMNAAQYEDALKLFKGFSPELFSAFDRVYYEALLLIESGQPSEAEALLTSAKVMESEDASQLKLLLGLAHMHLGEWSKAQVLLTSTKLGPLPLNTLLLRVVDTARLAPDPINAGAILVNSSRESAGADKLNYAAALLFNLKNFKQAEAIAREAILTDANHAGAFSTLGSALFSLQRKDEARESLRQALKIQPNYPQALSQLALMEYEEGNNYLALLQLVQALDQDITYRAGWGNYLTLLSQELVPREGLEVLPSPPAEEAAPAVWHWEQAVTAFKSNMAQLSTRHFLRSLSLNLNDPNVHNDFASLLYGVGHKPLALPFMRASATLVPDSKLVRDNLEHLRSELIQEDLEQEVTALRHKLDTQAGNESGEDLFALANLYGQLNRQDEALAVLEKALKFNPEHREVRLTLAQLLAHMKRYPEAINVFHPVLNEEPTNPRWVFRMAWLLVQQPEPGWRDLELAEALALKACEITGNQRVDCLELLAKILTANGKSEDAQEVQKKVDALKLAASAE